ASRQAVVVEPQERDHVIDVLLVGDAAGSRPDLPREDRMLDDPALFEQLSPYVLREVEVRCVIAVQVADLAPANLEGELAAPTRSRFHLGPGCDLLGDLLAWCLFFAH